jgi:uncharacterized protein YgiM (DUF1202 family)
MTTRIGSIIRSLLLIGSVLIVSACASTTPREVVANKTDETARVVIEKGKFDTPPALPQPAAPRPMMEPVKTASQTAQVTAQVSPANIARIHPKERSVNIRTSPSVKSRIVAKLKGGHSIEVLETRDNWLKVKWQKGAAVRQGWLKRRFVEGYEQ